MVGDKFYLFLITILIIFSVNLVAAELETGFNDNENLIVSLIKPSTTSPGIVDTNATTECGDGEFLRGDGTCQVLSGGGTFNQTYQDYVANNISNRSYFWNNLASPLDSWLSTFNITYHNNQDTNATTECGDGFYLDGSSACIHFNNTVGQLTASMEFNASSITTIVGDLDSGTLGSILTRNNSFYNVSEVTGSPGYNIQINFTSVDTFNRIVARLRYEGSPAHAVVIELKDCITGNFDTEFSFTDTDGVADFIKEVLDPTDHICGINQNVTLQIRHASSGNPAHDLFLDGVHLVKGATTSSPTEVDPLAFHKSGDVTIEGNANWGGFNISNIDWINTRNINATNYCNATSCYVLNDFLIDVEEADTWRLNHTLYYFSSIVNNILQGNITASNIITNNNINLNITESNLYSNIIVQSNKTDTNNNINLNFTASNIYSNIIVQSNLTDGFLPTATLYTNLSNYLLANGSTTPTGNFNLGGFNISNVGNVTSDWAYFKNLNVTGTAYIGELTWNGNLDLGGNNITNVHKISSDTATIGNLNYLANSIEGEDIILQSSDNLDLFAGVGVGVNIGSGLGNAVSILGKNISVVDKITFIINNNGIDFNGGTITLDSNDDMQFDTDSGDFNFNNGDLENIITANIGQFSFDSNEVVSDSAGSLIFEDVTFFNGDITSIGNTFTTGEFIGDGSGLTGISIFNISYHNHVQDNITWEEGRANSLYLPHNINNTNINILSINATEGKFNGNINVTAHNLTLTGGGELKIVDDTAVINHGDGGFVTDLKFQGNSPINGFESVSFGSENFANTFGFFVGATASSFSTAGTLTFGASSASATAILITTASGGIKLQGSTGKEIELEAPIIRVDGNLLMDQDVDTFCMGTGGCSDFNMSFDGSDTIFNTKGGQDFIFKNGTGFGKLIAHEYSIASPELGNYNGDFLSYLKSPNDMLINGKIDRSILIEGLEKSTEQIRDGDNCWEVFDKELNETIIECGTKDLNVTNVAGMQMVDRLMISELLERLEFLEENCVLK